MLRSRLTLALLLGVAAPSGAVAHPLAVFINDVRADGLRSQTLQNVDVYFDEQGDLHIRARGYRVSAVDGEAPATEDRANSLRAWDGRSPSRPASTGSAAAAPPSSARAPSPAIGEDRTTLAPRDDRPTTREAAVASPVSAAPRAAAAPPLETLVAPLPGGLRFYIAAFQPNRPAQWEIDVFVEHKFVRRYTSRDPAAVTEITSFLRPGLNTVTFQARREPGSRLTSSPGDYIELVIGDGQQQRGADVKMNRLIAYRRHGAEIGAYASEATLRVPEDRASPRNQE